MASGNNRTFVDFEPSVDWSRADDVDFVKISLPGFKREEIRVLVDNHGHLRTRGDRPIAGTRWSRFQKDFKLPENCNVDGIRAKFENETLTITLPKKSASPPAAPVPPPKARTPPVPEPRRTAAAPLQKPPPALPEPPARPASPVAPLPPAPSQRLPAERQPSLHRKPSGLAPAAPARLPSVQTPPPAPRVEPPKKNNGSGGATAKPEAPAAEDEAKRMMDREAMGKMAEDREATEKKEADTKEGENAAMGDETMEMARRPRPASASRGMLVNVAVAVVVLIGITVYVWHTLRNAAGGAGHHGHGEAGAGSYGDEM